MSIEPFRYRGPHSQKIGLLLSIMLSQIPAFPHSASKKSKNPTTGSASAIAASCCVSLIFPIALVLPWRDAPHHASVDSVIERRFV
jgi:hypothetical protein